MPVFPRQPQHTLSQQALAICVCLTFFALPIGTAPFTLTSLLVLAVWLFSGIGARERRHWQSQNWFLPLVLLIILPWVGMLWSSAAPRQALDLAVRSHYWLFALVSCSVMSSERWLRNAQVCFIAATSLVALVVMAYLSGWIPETVYLQKFLFHSYITYSLFLVISILLMAFFYRSSTWPYNVLIVALMLFLALTVTHLKGRSAYLALAALSPWMFVTMFGRRRIVSVMAALAVTGALLLTSSTVRGRLELIPKEIRLYNSGVNSTYQLPDGTTTPSSIGIRIDMWRHAVKIFREHPLIGAGTAGYQSESSKVDPSLNRSHPHNSYLYVAASYGFLGIGLYGWLLYVTLKRAWRSRHTLSGHTILAFVLVIMIGSLTDTQILTAATGVVLGFVVGIPTTEDSPCAY